jgi:hypothetical protein
MSIEDELWDDSGSVSSPAYHVDCGGRVYWVSGDEWRCLKCCAKVNPEEMISEEEREP